MVAAVVDRTELSWDDPVEKWLPEFKGDPKGVIPLRRLLSHTSGIRPYLPDPRVDNYNHLDSAVAEILPLDTVFTPGTRFEYGGLAMQVAGRMAELAAGKEFETLFQELLAGPLRMTRSHFTPVNTDGGHAPMLGGGLCTTLNDYMNFLDMIIHGGVFEGQRILREATVKEMQADQVGRAKVAEGEYVSVRSGGIIKAFTDWANGVKWWTRRPERPIVSVRRDGPEPTLGLTCARVSMVSSLPM